MIELSIGKLRLGVSFSFFAVIALILTLSENSFVLMTLSASILHELGHIFAMCLLNVAPEKIVLYGGGVKMTADRSRMLSHFGDACILLAGSFANMVVFSATAFCANGETATRFATVNLVLAVFNLLPFKYFDGGRILALCESTSSSLAVSRTVAIIRATSVILAIVTAVAIFLCGSGNLSLAVTLVYIIVAEILC